MGPAGHNDFTHEQPSSWNAKNELSEEEELATARKSPCIIRNTQNSIRAKLYMAITCFKFGAVYICIHDNDHDYFGYSQFHSLPHPFASALCIYF